MKVFILAGGLGTRIRALYPDCPKALVPVGGRPFLEWQIRLLREQGFDQFVLCVGHLAGQIIDCFGDGRQWDCHIQYSVEPRPLGTAGALKNAAAFFDGPALVLNGDTLLPADFRDLLKRHHAAEAVSSAYKPVGGLALVWAEDTSQYGHVSVDDGRRITGFVEKAKAAGPGFVNAGAYVLAPEVLAHIDADKSVSLERSTFPELAACKVLHGLPLEGFFYDMGTPEGLLHLSAWLQEHEY